MNTVRSESCSACPYRRDVPSGVWSAAEYDKLAEYDGPIHAQSPSYFACHATPDFLCHGWAVVHGSGGKELLGLRILQAINGGTEIVIPDAGSVPLFSTGREAAEHGKRDIEHPSPEALRTARRLVRKHPRLEWS